jgi:hypothetical protein
LPHIKAASPRSEFPFLYSFPIVQKIKAQADPGTVLAAQYQFPLGQIALRKCTGQEDGPILP